MKACDFCGEPDHKLRRISVVTDKRLYARWKLCKACAAGLLVLIIDPRKHRANRGGE